MQTKGWIIIAASLLLLGYALFTGVMITLDWDFRKLATVQRETNTHEISEAFDRISMNTNTADIAFALSENGTCRVECREEENAKHLISLKDHTLFIEAAPKEHWYDYIGINFGKTKITVYLPQAEYASLLIKESTGDIEIPKGFNFKNVDIALSTGDVDFEASDSEIVKVKTNTGNIFLKNISAGALDLSVSTGKVTVSGVTCAGDIAIGVSTGKAFLTDVNCKSLISSGSTGDISLNHVIAEERFSIERSTGDVEFSSCDAAEISVKTDTGDVAGTLLTEKVFVTQTDTGRINVPKTAAGGKCEISTDTGDIIITMD